MGLACSELYYAVVVRRMLILVYGLMVFYRAPPICPPRSPSPSPAKRERGIHLCPSDIPSFIVFPISRK